MKEFISKRASVGFLNMRRRSFKAAAIVLSVAAISACSSHHHKRKPQSDEVAKAPDTVAGFRLKATYEPVAGLKIFDYVHDASGLEVLLNTQPGTNTVAYVTSYNVGSRFEAPGRTGLAHLFEHLMFRGTESYARPFETLSGWGNSFNAYTAFDMTVYYEVVPKTVLEEVAKFESERMRKLKITEEGFTQERGAVISERKMRTEDSPSGRLYWELYQTFFQKHPYQTPPIGWQEDLNATSYQDALDFYNRFYAPNRAVMALVGDFKVEDALNILAKNYGSFKKVEFVEPKIPQELPRKTNVRKEIPMKTETVMLSHATLGTRMNDKTVPADSLFCTLLTDSRIGYLQNELVEKNIAKSVSASCSPNVDPGLNVIFVSGNPGVTIPVVEKAFDAAMKKFGEWLTADRVEKAKMYYLAAQWSDLRDPDNLAQTVARSVTESGNAMYDFDFLKLSQAVTRDQVFARYEDWKKQKFVRLILKPADKNPPFTYPARYRGLLKATKKAAKTAAHSAPDSTTDSSTDSATNSKEAKK